MGTLILNGRALGVRLEGAHVAVTRHDAPAVPAEHVPLAAIERVVVVGRPALTFPVLAAFMERAIPCVFFDGAGRWRGALECHDEAFHGRRRRHYLRLEDAAFRLGVARRLVAAKIRNARRVVRRLTANRPAGALGVAEAMRVDALAQALREARAAPDAEALRGIEGQAAATHFAMLGRFFPPHLPFAGRSRHPPRDAANALLSWLYALLLGEVVMALHAHGLDPAAGCLHQNGHRAPALALDLMEPFRPVCGDLIACDLASHGVLRAERDFRACPGLGVRLGESARALALGAFARAMERPFHARSPRPGVTTLRGAIQALAADFARAVETGDPALRVFLLP